MTGVFVPAGTPKEVVALLQKEISAIVNEPKIKARMLELGVVASGDSSEDFTKYVKDEVAKWKGVIEKAHIKKI
jgi:tripartite-type tricarboxylate transporter receptor subunit TctC